MLFLPTSLALVAVLAALVAASRHRPAIGAIGLLAMAPFYYVIRGTAGQSAFAFLWPYLYLAAYTHVLGLRAMTSSSRSSRAAAWERQTMLALYGLLAMAAAVSFRFVVAAATHSVTDTLRQFNGLAGISLIVLAGVVTLWPLGVLLLREPRRLSELRAPDWAIAAFLAYGVVQLLLSLVRTEHFFYSVESFRYYFLMAWAYFALRFGLESEQDAKLATTTFVATTLVVAGEFVLEHFLFNAGMRSTSLPWLGAFEGLFAGYGTPIPVDGFYIMTRESETVFLPYHGIRGMGLFIHPHTAGFYVLLGGVFLIARYFDSERRGWLVLAGLMLLFYANMLTLSRAALMLMYAALLVVPLATAWVLRRRFAVRRVLPYLAALMVTLYAGATLSPGGELPLFKYGWYARPIVFTARAMQGDTLLWASATAIAGRGGEEPRTIERVEAAEAAATGRSEESSEGTLTAVTGTLRLLGESNLRTIVLGYGFSPLTKYVVDFFPEASGFRHLMSNADIALLEFLQQFGVLGLAILLTTFAVFGWVGWQQARRSAAHEWRLIALAVSASAVAMAIALLHLYPLFRTGVNTDYYGMLGVLGFLHARSCAAAVAAIRPAGQPVVAV